LDIISIIMDSPTIEEKLASRLRDLRASRGWSLESLAERSGVSRSMISLIERSESSPTANVLDKLAGALGVTLGSLFAETTPEGPTPLARRGDQRVWRDPETGYLRRNLSPPGFPTSLELVEVVLPPDSYVAYDSPGRVAPLDQQVFVLEGKVQISVDEDFHEVDAGDCLAMRVERRSSFRNSSDAPARYLIAITIAAARYE
jgi:transcriptional regulator with XRE-family HTH domain